MRTQHRIVATAIVWTLTALSIYAAGKSDVADAVMKGDKAALRTLLQQKADVNAPQIDGATALHWAVYRGDLDSAALLIRAGAKVNAANREGMTPIAMGWAGDPSFRAPMGVAVIGGLVVSTVMSLFIVPAMFTVIDDFQQWLEQLAPSGLDYEHHQTGEDNADAHLKRTLMGHQVMLPITGGTLDLGPWEQVFYAEFDGQRKKRVVIKVMGE